MQDILSDAFKADKAMQETVHDPCISPVLHRKPKGNCRSKLITVHVDWERERELDRTWELGWRRNEQSRER